MKAQHPADMPTTSVPFPLTVRFVYYLTVLARVSIPLVAGFLTLLILRQLGAAVEEDGVERNYGIRFWQVVLLAALFPPLLLFKRVVWGFGGRNGILFCIRESDAWRRRWRQITDASVALQRKCRRQRQLFALPSSRAHYLPDEDDGSGYVRPEDVLADIPEECSYECFGALTNQPLQVFDAGCEEHARGAVRRIAALVAGRVLDREVPFVAMKRESGDALRLHFLTVVENRPKHRAYLWTTLHLQMSGTTVTGVVEVVRSYYFGRGECESGEWHWGDELKAKDLGSLALTLLGLLPPFCFFATPFLIGDSLFELLQRRFSAAFYYNHRPDAGDSVDLFLIGEARSSIVPVPSFVSQVDAMQNDILQEIHKVTGIFAGVMGEV